MRIAGTLLALFGTAISALPAASWNVRTELLGVRVSQDAGLRLRGPLRHRGTIAKAVADLQTLVANGQATLIGAPVLWCVSGSRAVVETHEEVRFHTEFDPPHPPQNFYLPTWQPREPASVRLRNFARPFLDVPVQVETRNAGIALEIEPTVVPDGLGISLALTLGHVSFEGFRKVVHSPAHADDMIFAQPGIRSGKLTTSLEMVSGEWQLLNVSVLPGKSPAMEFFLLRTTALPHHP